MCFDRGSGCLKSGLFCNLWPLGRQPTCVYLLRLSALIRTCKSWSSGGSGSSDSLAPIFFFPLVPGIELMASRWPGRSLAIELKPSPWLPTLDEGPHILRLKLVMTWLRWQWSNSFIIKNSLNTIKVDYTIILVLKITVKLLEMGCILMAWAFKKWH